MRLQQTQLDDAERMLQHLEEVERQLNVLRDGLMRSHRLSTLGTIATIIAHEFNNILTPVISYCQMARKSPDDIALMRKAIDKALFGAEQAAKISASMLGFMRDDEPSGSFTSESACLREVIDATFHCLARAPEKDRITLTINVDDALRVAMPATALQQVLMNLVLNAHKAMSGQPGRLDIAARREGETVVLAIADTGRGIAPQVLPHIFDPFVTHDDAQASDPMAPKGTGLGLAICRELVRRVRGEIEVAATGPEGTRFEVTLPRAK